jgi:hypothetical protein
VVPMERLRVVHRSSATSGAHGSNLQTHRPGPRRSDRFGTEEPLGRSEMAESGTELRRLLEAVRVSAPADVVARLEGAIIALDALAAGKPPSADDLLVPGPYTI